MLVVERIEFDTFNPQSWDFGVSPTVRPFGRRTKLLKLLGLAISLKVDREFFTVPFPCGGT
jgi:hypothetical protein